MKEHLGMPTCRDMSELVTDYLERVVSLRTRLDMWWHLFRCEACRRYYDQMRRTVRLLRSERPDAPDSDTEDGVVAAARSASRRDQ
jgi:predicted anti-sigma-YlaC factor YlaD